MADDKRKFHERFGLDVHPTAEEARMLFDSIDTATIVGQRDRAIIGTLLYSFARVGAEMTAIATS